MSENLETYDLNGRFLGVQDRDEFYKEIKQEFKETGKITRQVKAVKMILVTSEGRIYIQKRSRSKKENSGLYDKTTGGHVKAGHTMFLTAVQECHEELGIPAVVLSQEEFDQAIPSVDLSIIAILRQVEHLNQFISIRTAEDGEIEQPLITTFYIGYYDGPIHFKDGEATGIQVFSLEELRDDINRRPEDFTEDIKFMIKRYERYLEPLKNRNKPVIGR